MTPGPERKEDLSELARYIREYKRKNKIPDKNVQEALHDWRLRQEMKDHPEKVAELIRRSRERRKA